MSVSAGVDPKLRKVEIQIRAMERGEKASILCPYCGAITPQGETLCCELLLMAMSAVVDRFDSNDRIDHAERVAEKASKN